MQAHHTTRGWLAVEWHLGVGGISLLNFCNAYSYLPGNNHCPLPGDVYCSLPRNICQCPAWARLQSMSGTLASSLPSWERLPVCIPCLGMLAVPSWNACQFAAWERLPVPCLGTIGSSLPGHVLQSLPGTLCKCPTPCPGHFSLIVQWRRPLPHIILASAYASRREGSQSWLRVRACIRLARATATRRLHNLGARPQTSALISLGAQGDAGRCCASSLEYACSTCDVPKARGWCQPPWLGFGESWQATSQKSTSVTRRQYS